MGSYYNITGKKFIGILDNEPYHLPLKIGNEISFGIENICATEYHDPNSSEWNFYFDTLVTGSKDVLDMRIFNFMLRITHMLKVIPASQY